MINTTKNRFVPSEESRRGVVRSVGDVLGDVTNLAELQFELLKVDLAASSRKLVRGLIFGAAAVLILAGCIPVALLAITAFLVQQANLSIAASIGVALGIGIVFAFLIALGAFVAIKSSTSYFERSQSEFKRNIAWLKGLKNRESRNRRDFDTPQENRNRPFKSN